MIPVKDIPSSFRAMVLLIFVCVLIPKFVFDSPAQLLDGSLQFLEILVHLPAQVELMFLGLGHGRSSHFARIS
jgi:hypothetical protein